MRRLINRLYYVIETLLTRSPGYQLMLVAATIVALSVGGGVLVHLTNPSAFQETSAAIWWAFLRLTDPGYLGDDRGFFPRLISTFLTLAGYVVFLGALVALMTNWLDRLLAFLASGRSPIFEKNHVLIIGWNERLHALIEEIVHTDQKLRGRDVKPAIAVLCEPYDPSMHHRLMQKLDPAVRQQCRLLIRSGNPLEAESLERVDFAHARCIILISNAGGDRSARYLSDITLAKVLMSMRALAPELESPPNVVVEVSISGNKLLAESVGWTDRTEAVVADDIMGRLFCQAIRFPGISKVYQRLLTDTFSDSILLRSARDLKVEDKTVREIVGELEEGTPIGFLKAQGRQQDLELLNLDAPLKAEDQLVIVTSTGARKDRDSRAVGPGARLDGKGPVHKRVLVVGWSTDLHTFLKESSAYRAEKYDVTCLWEKTLSTERERIERLAEASPNLDVSFVQGTLLEESELVRLNLAEYNKVLLLADQSEAPLVADAENVLRYVLIDRYIRARQTHIDLVVELNDEDNKALLTGSEPDVLMTGEILSHLLAQVSTHRSLMWTFEELFSKGGAELRLRSVSRFSENQVSYAVCQSLCLEQGAISLGYLSAGQVHFNPLPEVELTLTDRLILVEMEH